MIDMDLTTLSTELEALLSRMLAGTGAKPYIKLIHSLLATITPSTREQRLPTPTQDPIHSQSAEPRVDELTITEQQAFNGAVDAVLSDEAVGGVFVKKSSQDAVNAIVKIEKMFLHLTKKLTEIDRMEYPDPVGGRFTPRLIAIHEQFKDAVGLSRDLALETALYGERFESLIIPMAANGSYTPEMRASKVQAFIQQADTFATCAANVRTNFTNLSSSFAQLTGSFGNWASSQEVELFSQGRQADKELKDITANLDSATKQLNFITAACLGYSPPVGVGVWTRSGTRHAILLALGPYMPYVIVAGIIAAGCGVAYILNLIRKWENLQSEMANAQEKHAAIMESIGNLTSTREKLKVLGEANLNAIEGNIRTIHAFWLGTQNDARCILSWLEEGANYADMPEYMQISFDKATAVYASMAVYLRHYADGITAAVPEVVA